MGFMRKGRILWLAAGVLAAAMALPSYAASRKAIKSITLGIKADIMPDTDFGDETIEIEAGGSKYSVDGYEILNDDNEWRDNTVPRIRITLIAEDDYYFQSLPKNKIHLKGGAAFKRAERENGGSMLLMDVELPALQTGIRDVENLKLSEDGIATWDAVSAAGVYEVRVYREGQLAGSSMKVKTNSANCRERMSKGESTYTVKVRPVNRFEDEEKGGWVESAGVYITSGRAAGFRENPAGTSGAWVLSQENGRWWYDNGDGTYPAGGWEQIGGRWYFFDDQGYMQTGWVHWDGKEYYCSENGDMQVDCMTPDNYWVGGDGAKISQ